VKVKGQGQMSAKSNYFKGQYNTCSYQATSISDQ